MNQNRLKKMEITRRNVLINGGWLLGGSMACRSSLLFAQDDGSANAPDSISPVMQTLSTYMAGAADKPLPDEVTEQAKHHVLDTFAAMISGSQLPPGRAATDFARNYEGSKGATVVASDFLRGPMEAAEANGVMAQADETDDSNSPSQSHPGCAVVPAALAMAEQGNISGLQFLRAVTLGYDIGCRVGITLGAINYQTKTHRDPHATSDGFGAAAAAGCAASLNANQFRFLLDYASQESSGVAAWQRDLHHFEKAFVFGGMTARNGVNAAMLVHAGWTGVDDIFSGPDNFLLAYNPQANPQGLIDQLGQRFEVSRTNIKKWSIGSPIQAPADALDDLMKQHSFTPDQVQKIDVRVATQEASIVDNRTIPDICLQHMLALLLVRKTIAFRDAHDASLMKDPAILKERAKITLIGDEDLEKLLPARVAIVTVTLKDGSHFTRRVDAVKGSAENPMTRDEVVAKSKDLIVPVLGEQKSSELVRTILQIENVKQILELRPLLQLSS